MRFAAVIGVVLVVLVAYLVGTPTYIFMVGLVLLWLLVAIRVAFAGAANPVEAILFVVMLCSPLMPLAVLGLEWRYRQLRRNNARA